MIIMVPYKIIIQLFALIVLIECNQLIVNTTCGLLRGREFKSRNGRVVAAFSGVPFARPPIGQLRFQDPQPPEAWSGIRDAYNFGSVCVHIPYLYSRVATTMMGNEDCLYLSVYTPTTKPKKLLPVIVYIHGGGFASGSGEVDKSPEFFMDHDIVMVMPNYRIGPLGFLSMEDDVMPGNMGLKDQNMALVWVQNNIANFGGDPSQVTLIGESAGGASVHYHMLSPMSKGLYHRAISESGTALCPWASTPPGVARNRAIKMALFLNCSTGSSQLILDCLQARNAYDITKQFKSFFIYQTDPGLIFLPINDKNSTKSFLPFDPHEAEPAAIPWMVSVDSLEGILRSGGIKESSAHVSHQIVVSVFLGVPGFLEDFDKNFNWAAPITMMYEHNAENPIEMSKQIRNFYFGDQPLSYFVFNNVTDMIGDSYIVWPSILALKKHKGQQYFYYFNYLGSNSFQEVFTTSRVLRGAAHADETIYIWKINNPFEIQPPTTPMDLNLSHLLVKLVVNFATVGNPTPADFEFNWPVWDNKRQNFISFENRGVMNYTNFLPDRMQFWSQLNN